jgi:SAM-dependent methyltransferase
MADMTEPDFPQKRYQKEMQFHDRVFSDRSARQGVERFYSVVDRQKEHFFTILRNTVRPGMTVLEYGCGPNTASRITAGGGAKVIGIDISPVAIRKYVDSATERRVGTVTGCVMNAEILGFGDNTFDLISGVAILHHLDLERSYREISRVLKPGGRAVFIEPLGHNPAINFYRTITPSMRTEDEHPLMVKDLKMAERCFGRIDVQYFNLTSMMAVPFRRFACFSRLVSGLSRFDDFLFDNLPFTRRYAWSTVVTMADPIKERLIA